MKLRHFVTPLLLLSLAATFAYGIIVEYLYALRIISWRFIGDLITAKSAAIWMMWGCLFLCIFMALVQFAMIPEDNKKQETEQ